MCKGIILSDQDPAKTRITFELNHKGSNFQAKLLHKETKVLYQKDKDVIGKKESTIAQKSCFWAISDLVLYLKSSIEVSKLAT